MVDKKLNKNVIISIGINGKSGEFWKLGNITDKEYRQVVNRIENITWIKENQKGT